MILRLSAGRVKEQSRGLEVAQGHASEASEYANRTIIYMLTSPLRQPLTIRQQ